MEWSINDEIRLFRWITEFKPVGPHKSRNIEFLLERLNQPDKYPVLLLQKETGRVPKVFSKRDVVQKLGQYYDLERANKIELGEPLEGANDSDIISSAIDFSQNGHGATLDHKETEDIQQLDDQIIMQKSSEADILSNKSVDLSKEDTTNVVPDSEIDVERSEESKNESGDNSTIKDNRELPNSSPLKPAHNDNKQNTAPDEMTKIKELEEKKEDNIKRKSNRTKDDDTAEDEDVEMVDAELEPKKVGEEKQNKRDLKKGTPETIAGRLRRTEHTKETEEAQSASIANKVTENNESPDEAALGARNTGEQPEGSTEKIENYKSKAILGGDEGASEKSIIGDEQPKDNNEYSVGKSETGAANEEDIEKTLHRSESNAEFNDKNGQLSETNDKMDSAVTGEDQTEQSKGFKATDIDDGKKEDEESELSNVEDEDESVDNKIVPELVSASDSTKDEDENTEGQNTVAPEKHKEEPVESREFEGNVSDQDKEAVEDNIIEGRNAFNEVLSTRSEKSSDDVAETKEKLDGKNISKKKHDDSKHTPGEPVERITRSAARSFSTTTRKEVKKTDGDQTSHDVKDNSKEATVKKADKVKEHQDLALDDKVEEETGAKGQKIDSTTEEKHDVDEAAPKTEEESIPAIEEIVDAKRDNGDVDTEEGGDSVRQDSEKSDNQNYKNDDDNVTTNSTTNNTGLEDKLFEKHPETKVKEENNDTEEGKEAENLPRPQSREQSEEGKPTTRRTRSSVSINNSPGKVLDEPLARRTRHSAALAEQEKDEPKKKKRKYNKKAPPQPVRTSSRLRNKK